MMWWNDKRSQSSDKKMLMELILIGDRKTLAVISPKTIFPNGEIMRLVAFSYKGYSEWIPEIHVELFRRGRVVGYRY